MSNQRDICFATFNLYNLQAAGENFRGNRYSADEYRQKINWSRQMMKSISADVVAFQELWAPECLHDILEDPALSADYSPVFIRDEGWYDIAVAAAVRKPWRVVDKKLHKEFPDGFKLIKREVDRAGGGEDEDDDIDVTIRQFSRTVLQLSLEHEAGDVPRIEFFALHLKSKLPTRLDRQEKDNPAVNPHQAALGQALSTIRRTAESAALRIILSNVMNETVTPVVVAGDFNDAPNSNTLAIATAQPSYRLFADSRTGQNSDRGLYQASALNALNSFRDVDHTHVYKGEYDSLDHILVSEQFYDHSKNRVWSFRDQRVWNDFLPDHGAHGETDHGVVAARFDYNPA